jgi:hypothetical protein
MFQVRFHGRSGQGVSIMPPEDPASIIVTVRH